MNWQGLDPSILGPAFAVGIAVLATHVPLGREVLRRGIIFLDLAVAQIAALGILVANIAFGPTDGLKTQVAAIGAAVAGALLLGWCERRHRHNHEAIIGSAFVVAASLGILLLAGDPHGGEHLEDMLAGQILWVDWTDAGRVAVVSLAILVAWYGFAPVRKSLFYLVFAISITISVQVVGLYLVFASLVIPALSTHPFSDRDRERIATLAGYAVGAGAYLVGLSLSGLLDLPAGPLIVVTLAGSGAIVASVRRMINPSGSRK